MSSFSVASRAQTETRRFPEDAFGRSEEDWHPAHFAVQHGELVGGRRSDRANLVALSAVWLVMVVLVHPVGDFPVQDDWAYALAVRSLVEAGVYRIPDFVSADLGPLVHWGALFSWPFGFSFTALRVSTLVMGLAGVAGVYFLVREVWSDRLLALVVAATMLVNPIYFSLANTFMTDVPFIALLGIAMALIVRGLRREDQRVLGAGLAVCLVAVLVRQFALVVFGGFACAWVARRGCHPREIVKASAPLAVGIAAHVAFSQWLIQTARKGPSAGIADLTTASIGDFVYSSAHELFNAINELGLFLLPIALFCFVRGWRIPGAGVKRWPVLVTLATGAAIAWWMVDAGRTMPLSGDTLHYFGIGPLMLRDMLLLGSHLPPMTAGLADFWIAMTALAIVGAMLIVLALTDGSAMLFGRRRPFRESLRRAWPALFFAVTALGYLSILLLLATRHTLFDRYLLPLMPIVALALPAMGREAGAGRGRWTGYGFAGVFLIASACFSVIATHDFLAWNRTRWMALDDLMRGQGVSPHQIDGGYEFNGWFLYDPRYRPHDGKSWWWVDDDEYLIAGGPMPGYRIERRWPVDRWWTGTNPDVFVLKRADAPAIGNVVPAKAGTQ